MVTYSFAVVIGKSLHFDSFNFPTGYNVMKNDLQFRISGAVMMTLFKVSLFFYGMEIFLLLNY
jgi:hypothetical protein